MSNDNDNDPDNRFRNIRVGKNDPNPLDELAEQIRNLFRGGENGHGGGGKSGGPYGESKLPENLVLYAALAIVLVAAIFSSFYTVDVSEEAVVTRFEKYQATNPPGLHFKLPFGIDRVTKVPSKVLLQEEFGFRSVERREGNTQYAKNGYGEESLMLTGDLNVADVEWIVQYRISDPWKFLFHARNVQKNIRDISLSIMRRVVGDRLVGDVLTVGRVEIADEAKVLTQEVVDRYDMGIIIVAVVLQDVTPPESVKVAFNDVNAAKQEQEKAINVAEREYNNVIPEAKGKAEQVIAVAEGFSLSLINQSKGDASKFNSMLTEFKKSPDVTRRRMYVEAMEEIYSNLESLVIVDPNIKGILPMYPSSNTTLPAVKESGVEK
ncbi:MAG: FtsH protease activity modulator HflK [Oligoflexus sp.]|nr:FtsH protease activity modulator HflK [Oligoflexus sp.]